MLRLALIFLLLGSAGGACGFGANAEVFSAGPERGKFPHPR